MKNGDEYRQADVFFEVFQAWRLEQGKPAFSKKVKTMIVTRLGEWVFFYAISRKLAQSERPTHVVVATSIVTRLMRECSAFRMDFETQTKLGALLVHECAVRNIVIETLTVSAR